MTLFYHTVQLHHQVDNSVARPFAATNPGRRAQFSETASGPLAFVPMHPQPQHGGRGGGPPPVHDLTAYQAEGGGGGTTGGRSLQVIVFGSSHGASQGPVVPP